MATGQAAEQAAQRKGSDDKPRDTDRGPGSVAGNVTKDPDLRYTPQGRAVTTVRVAASSRVRNDRTGEWEDGPTEYFDVTAWGQLAENIIESLQKGDRIVAEGRWVANSWVDNDGVEHERITLTARDLGPSMLFRCARPVRPTRAKAGELWATNANSTTARLTPRSWLPGWPTGPP
jgi:single-strand DNA-binding protein